MASTRGFDRLGRTLFETSMDAGTHRSLFDAEGREVKHWHEDTEEELVYDLAGRLIERHVTHDSATWLAERMTYGEGVTGAADRNQLGRLVMLEDGAGREETTRYGAFGESLEVVRTLTENAGADPDWSGAVSLQSTSYETRRAFDALGRRTRAFLPDGTERRHAYLRSGPTAQLQVVTPDTTLRTILVAAEYNARGQQVYAELGNDVEVTSTYDEETFRLHRRHAVVDGTDTVQDLRHHYDPVGNLVYVDDLAQRPDATHVINGLTVTAERVFEYDARYQLVEATGRVHDALTRPDFRGDEPTSGSFRGTRRVGLNDGGAVSRYRRTYDYDHGGNLLGWQHGPEGAGAGNSWNHDKWVSSTSNRSYFAYDLNDIAISDPGSHFDSRGQITSLPNLRSMHWSPRNQLRQVVLIERSTDPDDDELYDYAADGTRLRKTTRRWVSGNVETTETLTLDGCELRRITQGSTPILERWSAHVEGEEGGERLATIYRWDTDTQARETDDVNAVRTHYHLGTQLGSVALELDASGALLSYEEYFPYGRTAFLAGDAVREIQLRTVRFVGKNQDDATGFYVFQYRYYAPYIGNWVSPDPAGEVDGPNRYWYARNNPASLVDLDGLQASPIPWQQQPPNVQLPETTIVGDPGGTAGIQVPQGAEGAPAPAQTPDVVYTFEDHLVRGTRPSDRVPAEPDPVSPAPAEPPDLELLSIIVLSGVAAGALVFPSTLSPGEPAQADEPAPGGPEATRDPIAQRPSAPDPVEARELPTAPTVSSYAAMRQHSDALLAIARDPTPVPLDPRSPGRRPSAGFDPQEWIAAREDAIASGRIDVEAFELALMRNERRRLRQADFEAQNRRGVGRPVPLFFGLFGPEILYPGGRYDPLFDAGGQPTPEGRVRLARQAQRMARIAWDHRDDPVERMRRQVREFGGQSPDPGTEHLVEAQGAMDSFGGGFVVGRSRLGSGGVLRSAPRVHMGRQGKHIPGHNNYRPGRSVLRADPEVLAARAGTGEQVGTVRVGRAGSKERVVFNDVIGDYVDSAGVSQPTTVGIIHYSRDGIHIVPGRPQ